MVFRLCKRTSWTYKWRTKSTSDHIHIMLVFIHVPLQNCQLYSPWKISLSVCMSNMWWRLAHGHTIITKPPYGNIYTGTTLRCTDIGSKDWINMLRASLHNQSWLSTVLPHRTQLTIITLYSGTSLKWHTWTSWLIGHLISFYSHPTFWI